MADRGPIRTCVGCRRRRPQAELVRFHADADARLHRSRTGAGRGAWVCADDERTCFNSAIERKAFARALRRTPDQNSIAELVQSWPGANHQ